jgi:hypothetical protein
MEYMLCEYYESAVMESAKLSAKVERFLMKFVKIQDNSVTEYAEIIKKFEGINPTDKQAILLLSKQIFK